MSLILLPEISLVLTSLSVLVGDLFLASNNKKWLGFVALLGLTISAFFLFQASPGTAFEGRFVLTSVGFWLKSIFLLCGVFAILLSWENLFGGWKLGSSGEFLFILLITLSGSFFLISSSDLVFLYVSLEVATIPLFALVAWKKSSSLSNEAAVKYVVLGALSSAFLLYGLSIIYGLTGEIDFYSIAHDLEKNTLAFWLATGLILSGVGFKLTLVPFHFWAADVYQGAPTPVTAYLSIGSKATGLAFLFQIFFGVFGLDWADNEAFKSWTPLIALLAAVTMCLGNLVAIVQNNIKRFMAFSSISQAGYLLMGFLENFDDSVPSMIFYLLVYVFSNVAVFSVIIFYENRTGKEKIGDYAGFSQTHPILAASLMIALFSLAGIPPLSGFVGKFFLFSIASQAGYHWLVLLAAVNSTISLYYYLRIVRQMYIEPPSDQSTIPKLSVGLGIGLAVALLGTVLLGVVPQVFESIYAATAGFSLK